MEMALDGSGSAVVPAGVAQERCGVLVDAGASGCCMGGDYFGKIPGASLSLLEGVGVGSAAGGDLQALGGGWVHLCFGGRGLRDGIRGL